jgi:glycerol-3-phosphate cytidylyltransferase
LIRELHNVKVATTGTFDACHMAHAAFLAKAARLGERLLVGVLSDAFVEQYKGQRPLFDQEERLGSIRELGYEAHVTSNQREFFTLNRADIIAVGSDWARKDYYAQIKMTQDELDFLRITLAYIPYTPGPTTTEIKRRALAA